MVLLSREFYDENLRPLLAKWMTIWMQQKRVNEVGDDQIASFLQRGPVGDPAAAPSGRTGEEGALRHGSGLPQSQCHD